MTAAGDDTQNGDGVTQSKVNYAQALVQLAEATLKNAQQTNSKAAAAVPASVVQSLQNDVSIAKARVRFFQDGGSGASEASYRAAARDLLSASEASFKQATDIDSRAPGTIGNAEVARRQAEVALAKARLDVCERLDLNKATDQQRMQWEVMLLQEDVHELRSQVELLKHQN